MSGEHTSHRDVLLRLKRAQGHLDKVIAMVENGEPCTPTAQQLHAVTKALENAKRLFVQDHIDNCITTGAARNTQEVLADLKEITKYL